MVAVEIRLRRSDSLEGFGFRIRHTGEGRRPTVSDVAADGPSAGLLEPGDEIVSVDGLVAGDVHIRQLLKRLRLAPKEVHLVVEKRSERGERLSAASVAAAAAAAAALQRAAPATVGVEPAVGFHQRCVRPSVHTSGIVVASDDDGHHYSAKVDDDVEAATAVALAAAKLCHEASGDLASGARVPDAAESRVSLARAAERRERRYGEPRSVFSNGSVRGSFGREDWHQCRIDRATAAGAAVSDYDVGNSYDRSHNRRYSNDCESGSGSSLKTSAYSRLSRSVHAPPSFSGGGITHRNGKTLPIAYEVESHDLYDDDNNNDNGLSESYRHSLHQNWDHQSHQHELRQVWRHKRNNGGGGRSLTEVRSSVTTVHDPASGRGYSPAFGGLARSDDIVANAAAALRADGGDNCKIVSHRYRRHHHHARGSDVGSDGGGGGGGGSSSSCSDLNRGAHGDFDDEHDTTLGGDGGGSGSPRSYHRHAAAAAAAAAAADLVGGGSGAAGVGDRSKQLQQQVQQQQDQPQQQQLQQQQLRSGGSRRWWLQPSPSFCLASPSTAAAAAATPAVASACREDGTVVDDNNNNNNNHYNHYKNNSGGFSPAGYRVDEAQKYPRGSGAWRAHVDCDTTKRGRKTPPAAIGEDVIGSGRAASHTSSASSNASNSISGGRRRCGSRSGGGDDFWNVARWSGHARFGGSRWPPASSSSSDAAAAAAAAEAVVSVSSDDQRDDHDDDNDDKSNGVGQGSYKYGRICKKGFVNRDNEDRSDDDDDGNGRQRWRWPDATTFTTRLPTAADAPTATATATEAVPAAVGSSGVTVAASLDDYSPWEKRKISRWRADGDLSRGGPESRVGGWWLHRNSGKAARALCCFELVGWSNCAASYLVSWLAAC